MIRELFRSIFRSQTKLATAGLLMALMLGWAQDYGSFFDAFSVFRLHFSILLAIVMLRLLWKRRWNWLLASAAAIAFSVWITRPYLPGYNLPERPVSEPDLTVVQFNTRFDNLATKRAIDVLRSVNADVYLMQELNGQNFGILRGLLSTHPHYIMCNKTGSAGATGIVSRIPFEFDQKTDCAPQDGFSFARLKVNGTVATLATLHLSWPWPGTQHKQITKLQSRLEELHDGPVVLAGDFNASPWTNIVQRVLAISRTRLADGMVMTWEPRYAGFHLPVGLILPIDHVMSRQLIPTSRRTLAFAGSDHRPVVTTFNMPKESNN